MAFFELVSEMDGSLEAKAKEFYCKGTNCGIIFDIDKGKKLAVLEQAFENISLDDLRGKVPAGQPKFVLYYYEHITSDGNHPFHVCFTFCHPSKFSRATMEYAACVQPLSQAANATMVFIVDNVDDLSNEWLKNKIAQKQNSI